MSKALKFWVSIVPRVCATRVRVQLSSNRLSFAFALGYVDRIFILRQLLEHHFTFQISTILALPNIFAAFRPLP